ncbi:MAG TPA: type II secretion system protein [Candidatus Omnitrophota bacterium]|nr:type II secretion system protein [Candidatus Omnitrophota bacterium]
MKRGFTLVEILIVIAVISGVIAGIFAVLNVGTASFNDGQALLSLQQNSRLAIDAMTQEIRQSQMNNLSIPTSTHIDFTIPLDITTSPITYSGTISYYLQDGQLIREYPSGWRRVVCNDINNIVFSNNTTSVSIQLMSSKTIDHTMHFNLTEEVKVRNHE